MSDANEGYLEVTNGITGNTAPSISAIADLDVPSGVSTGALAFTVGDNQTDPGSLTISGVRSNTTLVPNGNITFGGKGASRTVTITPVAGPPGSATIISCGAPSRPLIALALCMTRQWL